MRSAPRLALNRRPGARRMISTVLLIAFVATAAGLPMPTGSGIKSSDLFPCATSSCGCATAEQCWRSCCHTFTGRLAWARANGVRPPDFAIAKARAAGDDLSWLDDRNESQGQIACHARSCCDRAAKDSAAMVVHSCCSTKQAPKPVSEKTVGAWQALKCGGQSMNWLAAMRTLLNVQIDFNVEIVPPIWLPPPTSDHAQGRVDLPAIPPPKRA